MGAILLIFIFLIGFGYAKLREQNKKTKDMIKLFDSLESKNSDKYMNILNEYEKRL
jgi:preprotein translocase subunit YajC